MIPGIDPNLAYSVRDLDALSKQAFTDAVSKGRTRFAEECRMIGVSRNRFVVSGYTTRYDESEKYRGSSMESAGMRVMAASASMDCGGSSIKIDPGLAEIKVHLNMSFARKKTSVRAPKSATKKK